MSITTHPLSFIDPVCGKPAFHRSRVPDPWEPILPSTAAEEEHLDGSPCLPTDPFKCESCGRFFDFRDIAMTCDRWRYIPRGSDSSSPFLETISVNVLTMNQVFEAIRVERQKQDEKWGKDKPQSLAGYMLVIRKELEEAEDGWLKDLPGKSAPLNELVQVAAVAVAALERYGNTGNVTCTDDIPVPQT